jgi:hypothetical protein
MAMSSKRLLIAASAALGLAACNTANTHIGDEDAFFGEAVKYNAAVQTINPEPVYAEGSAEPGSNGAKGVAAVKRYRTDEVNHRHRDEVRAARSGGLSTTNTDSGSPQ